MFTDRILIVVAIAAVAAGAVWLMIQFGLNRSDHLEEHAMISQLRKSTDTKALKDTNMHIEMKGVSINAGTEGTFRIVFNGDGRFATTMDSEISYDTGFDGRMGWRVEWGGMPHKIELDELAWERLVVGIQTGQWLREASPFSIELKEEKPDELVFDVFETNGNFHADLTVDPSTGQPTQLVQMSGRGQEVVIFDRYESFAGLSIPTITSVIVSGIERLRFEVTSVVFDGIADYTMPTAIPDDVRFDANAPTELTLERAISGHLLVRPIINGEDLGVFIFDSGAAVSAVSKEAAAKLGLNPVGKLPLVSILGIQESPVYRVDTLQLGPATIENPLFLEMDLAPFAAALGIEINGIFGYDFLARTVVEVEVGTNTMRIFDPKAYNLSEGQWIDLILETQHPVVLASFPDAKDHLFRLDLGSQMGLIIHTPWVKSLGLLEGKDVTPTPIAPNLNGAVQEIAWFELAGQRFENLPAMHILDDVPPLNDRATTGNIGLQLLAGFRLVFNYMDQKIAFVPLE